MVPGKSLEDIIFNLIEIFRPYISGIKSVLDIGTGTSIPIHIVAEIFPEIRYHTADITDIRKKKKLPFTIYDGVSLPFNDKEFDVSVLNETLHHCEDPLAVLNEASRVANSVYVIEHFANPGATPEEIVETEFYALLNFDIDCKVYNPFTEYSLNKLFSKTGLKVGNKIEIPYYGQRKIRKYFFKLT
jgi:ubiquinone/menaquinone biosynthesis C-methylase UbiE